MRDHFFRENGESKCIWNPWLLAPVFVIALFLCPAPAKAATEFYVDPDYSGATKDGSPAHPWNNLDAGQTWTIINGALSSSDVAVYYSARSASSDTNQVSTFGVNLTRTNNSTHRLTVDGMSKYNTNDANPVWVSYSGPSKCEIRYGYSIESYLVGTNQNYVTIRGFKAIGGYNAYGGQPLNYWGGSHVIIENNELLHDPTTTHGATLQFGNNLASTDVTIRNNLIHDTFGEAIYVGSYYTENTPVYLDGVLIENNIIYNVGKYGGEGDCIDLKAGLAHVIIRNNICHDNQGGNATGISSLASSTGVVAEGNVIYNTTGFGAIAGPANFVLRRNLLFNNKSGIYLSDTPTLGNSDGQVINNTVYNCGYGLSVGVNGGGISNLQVKNNLFMKNGTGLGGWGSATYAITNNDIYANTTDYAYPFSPPYDPNLAGLNLSIDPVLVNPNNPAGPDGSFFSADDGFALQISSPVAHAGVGGTYIGALPPRGSRRDFSGDGKADVLLRHPSNGNVVLWLMP